MHSDYKFSFIQILHYYFISGAVFFQIIFILFSTENLFCRFSAYKTFNFYFLFIFKSISHVIFIIKIRLVIALWAFPFVCRDFMNRKYHSEGTETEKYKTVRVSFGCYFFADKRLTSLPSPFIVPQFPLEKEIKFECSSKFSGCQLSPFHILKGLNTKRKT